MQVTTFIRNNGASSTNVDNGTCGYGTEGLAGTGFFLMFATSAVQ